jgi:excisionase family DNA binding protein
MFVSADASDGISSEAIDFDPVAVAQDLRSYTTVYVAKRLGVSLPTVQRWVDAGHLKAWKTLGGHRRIEAESAERLFKAHEERMGKTPEAPAAREDLAPEAAKTVLIVDDNLMDRELMVWMVHKAMPEARIEVADSGFQALVIVGKVDPQVIITDINMPHMNGLEMIRSLSADSSSHQRKVLAVSALSRQAVAQLGTIPSNVFFLAKPLDENLFVEALLKEGQAACSD